MNFNEIFKKYKNIAVVGMSQYTYKDAHSVPAFFLKESFNIIPINPSVDEILSLKSYKNLFEVPDRIDILNIFRPSEYVLDIVKNAVQRHNEKGDIFLIWLQEGIFDNNAKLLAENNGIIFVQDLCIYKQYVNRVF